MRWMRPVGLVWWRRIRPGLKENLSGGIGLACGMKRGIFRMGMVERGFASEARSNIAAASHLRPIK